MLLVTWEFIGKNNGFSSGLGFTGMVFGWWPQGERGPGRGGALDKQSPAHIRDQKNGVSEAIFERVFICLSWRKFMMALLFLSSDPTSHCTPPPFLPPTSLTCESEAFSLAQVQNTPSRVLHYRLALFFCLPLCFGIYFWYLSFFYHFLSCYFLSCWTLLPFFSHVLCSSLALSSPQARH